MGVHAPRFVYTLYERRLLKSLRGAEVPRHVAVMLDGNRRWARNQGRSATFGHQAGASKIVDFLRWCEEAHIEVVTLWLLSTDNLKRDPSEVEPLLDIIAGVVEDLARRHRYPVRIVGNTDLLPADVAARLHAAVATTADLHSMAVNIAVGYGGRQEIADAVRAYLAEQAEAGRTLAEVADAVTMDDITEHLYTRGQPDPDLVIRTSGEQRMSGFLLWQSVHTELYFTEAYWPDFRRTDFLRALRDYSQRERRRGL
nr:isoprenyl transferase [Neoactinobaculum massilliense]